MSYLPPLSIKGWIHFAIGTAMKLQPVVGLFLTFKLWSISPWFGIYNLLMIYNLGSHMLLSQQATNRLLVLHQRLGMDPWSDENLDAVGKS